MSTHLNINDINFAELKFSRQKNSSERKFISVFYNKKSLSLILPKLRIPFHAQLSKFNQLEFNLSLGTDEELISKFKELDSQIVAFAAENEWITADSVYVPTLKEANGNAWPPTIRIKIPKRDDVIQTYFFDENKKSIEVTTNQQALDLLSKGTNVLSAVECVGLWFANGRYGLSWKADQIRVFPWRRAAREEITDNGYAFADSSDESEISNAELLIDDE